MCQIVFVAFYVLIKNALQAIYIYKNFHALYKFIGRIQCFFSVVFIGSNTRQPPPPPYKLLPEGSLSLSSLCEAG